MNDYSEYWNEDEQHLSALLRAIIRDQAREISPSLEKRSARNFWYDIKPILSRLGCLDAPPPEERTRDWEKDPTRYFSKKLSNYLAEMVADGELTYEDLRIEDDTRTKQVAVSRQHPHLVLVTEKDSVYPAIETVADFLGCSSISCSGQNAFAAAEYLLREISATTDEEEIRILIFGDYDPYGDYIVNSFISQVKTMIENLLLDYEVHVHHIGLLPSQLDPDLIEEKKFSIPQATKKAETVNRKWLSRTGGINGELFGLELDALTRTQMREILIPELMPYIERERALPRKKDFVTDIINGLFETQLDEVIEQVYREESDSIVDTGTDLWDLAIEGKSYLSATVAWESAREQEMLKRAMELFSEKIT